MAGPLAVPTSDLEGVVGHLMRTREILGEQCGCGVTLGMGFQAPELWLGKLVGNSAPKSWGLWVIIGKPEWVWFSYLPCWKMRMREE